MGMKETENSNKEKWLKRGLKVVAYFVIFMQIVFLEDSVSELTERNQKLMDCKCENVSKTKDDVIKKERGVHHDKEK